MLKILYYGGCWETNIGNAFLDYGSLYTIKTAVPDAAVYFASELARWFYKVNGHSMDNGIDLAGLSNVDYVVASGMVLYKEFLELEAPVIKTLSKRGVKIVFNGCGGDDYSKKEIDNFKRFLGKINVVGFISRDETAYNDYKDCFPKALNGLDCAFFLKEAFMPMPLTIKDYVVYSFVQKEPIIDSHGRKIILANHKCVNFFPKSKMNVETGLLISRTWPLLRIVKRKDTNRLPMPKNTLISNLPDDYLNLYANAYATYSDRIHASIATLSFGNRARLYLTPVNRNRVVILERAGVGEITKELTKLNQNGLAQDKERQISFLKEIFKEGQ